MAELTRRERERASHREQILDAAEAVFAEKGFRGATVQEIAARAEFSVGSLYNLFGNKEDLYVELVNARATEHLEEVYERLAREGDILAKLRAAVEAKFEFFRRRRRFLGIFMHLTADRRARGPVFMPESCRAQYERYLSALAEVFAEGTRRGLFVDADPMALAYCLEGMTRSITEHWLFTGGEAPEAKETQLVLGVLLRGILADGSRGDDTDQP